MGTSNRPAAHSGRRHGSSPGKACEPRFPADCVGSNGSRLRPVGGTPAAAPSHVTQDAVEPRVVEIRAGGSGRSGLTLAEHLDQNIVGNRNAVVKALVLVAAELA